MGLWDVRISRLRDGLSWLKLLMRELRMGGMVVEVVLRRDGERTEVRMFDLDDGEMKGVAESIDNVVSCSGYHWRRY